MELTQLTQITLILCSALIGGVILRKLKQPPLMAYMLVGVILGPSGIGLVEYSENIILLAEIGITLLLFIVGLELSLQSFRRVYKKTLFIVAIQILASLGLTFLIGLIYDWSLARILVFGFVISISSTAVAIGTLEDINELRTEIGQFAVGISIAQDLTVPFMLIIILSLSGESGFGAFEGAKLIGAAIILVALIAYLTKRERLRIPILNNLPENSNLLGLMALSLCFVAATLSGALGLSAAFGAFMAGLIIGASKDKQRVLGAVLPIQDLLMMVFFLSVGLLVDAERLIISGEGYKYLVAVIALTLLLSPIWLNLARKLVTIGKPQFSEPKM